MRSLYESWVQAWSPQKATSRAAHIRRIARINGLDRVNNVNFAKEPLGFTEIPPAVLFCVRRLAAPRRWLLSEDLPRPASCHTAHRSSPRARRAAASASSPTSRPPFPTREPRPHHSRSAALPMVKIKHAPGYMVPSPRFASSRVDAAARARQRSSFFPVLHVAIHATTPSPAAATGVAQAVCLCVTIGATQERWAALTP
jgi:hypothetical protein